jgi:hypothetical protein
MNLNDDNNEDFFYGKCEECFQVCQAIRFLMVTEIEEIKQKYIDTLKLEKKYNNYDGTYDCEGAVYFLFYYTKDGSWFLNPYASEYKRRNFFESHKRYHPLLQKIKLYNEKNNEEKLILLYDFINRSCSFKCNALGIKLFINK